MGIPAEYFECLKETGLPRQPTQYFAPCEKGSNTARIVELLGYPKLRIDFRNLARLRSHGYKEYLSRVFRHGTTSNGVFGAKIMWGHVSDFLYQLTGDPVPSSSQRVSDCLYGTFPQLRLVYVTRQDTLRQAVSLWKAIQSQQWRLDKGTPPVAEWRTPIFDFEAIDFLRRRLLEQDHSWRSFFAEAKIEPLILCYENFFANLDSTLAKIANFLGLNGRPVSHPGFSSITKQSDEQSDRWVKQYSVVLQANRIGL